MGGNLNNTSSVSPQVKAQKQPRLPKMKEDHGYPIGDQMLEAERSDLAGITKQYLDLSTVHGLRFDSFVTG